MTNWIYNLIYIDTKELAPEREGSCYSHKSRRLCSNRIYTVKAYTSEAHQAQGLTKRAIVLKHYQHKEHKGVLDVLSAQSFYIEEIVSLMETIVFNSIQVINYWFTLHCALRPLYQQAQIFSPYIWDILDQNVTAGCVFSDRLTHAKELACCCHRFSSQQMLDLQFIVVLRYSWVDMYFAHILVSRMSSMLALMSQIYRC